MKDLKIMLLAYREIHRLEHKILPMESICAIARGILPFVNIWFMANILRLLEQHAPLKTLSGNIVAAVSINLVLFFLTHYLLDAERMYRMLTYRKELYKVTEKLFSTTYKKMEDSGFRELIHQHAESEERVFSAFGQLGWMLRDFINGTVVVVLSFLMLIPLLKIGFTKTGETFLERPIFLICIFIALAVIVIIISVIAFYMNRAWYRASEEYSRLDRVFYYFTDMFSDYKTGKEIRLYKEQELIHHTATDVLLTDGERVLRRASMITARSSSLIALLGAVLGFAIYLFIGSKGLFGLFDSGSLILYCGAFMQVISGAMMLAGTFGRTAEMAPVVSYYFDIMQTQDDMTYGTQTLSLDNGLKIEFKQVTFCYPNAEKPALKNVNLTIHDKEKLAVVGRNGSGKTTFIKLLCRFYDVTQGEILLNDIPIQQYTKESLQSLISVVFQDFRIFAATVEENITGGNAPNKDALSSALRHANMQMRVLEMREQEKTYLYKDIDEKGVEISGGEAQKLAFARALYKNSPLVILDEPTATLDPISEMEMYQQFNSFAADKTAIYISHRLSSCAFCDRIAVFNRGAIVETGSHQELLAQNGIYADLWNAQAIYYMENNYVNTTAN